MARDDDSVGVNVKHLGGIITNASASIKRVQRPDDFNKRTFLRTDARRQVRAPKMCTTRDIKIS